MTPIDPDRARRERLVSYFKDDPGFVVFNVLRTQLLRICRKNGWRRIGFVSYAPHCGKTYVSVNLGYSIARRPETRVVLLDFDLRAPRVASMLGLSRQAGSIRSFLDGETPFEDYLRRIEPNLAIGLNGRREPDAAELVQKPETAAALKAIETALQPDIMIFDLSPLRVGDETLTMMSQLDGVALIAAAGTTTYEEIELGERTILEYTNFLGVILNKVTEAPPTYDYASAY